MKKENRGVVLAVVTMLLILGMFAMEKRQRARADVAEVRLSVLEACKCVCPDPGIGKSKERVQAALKATEQYLREHPEAMER